MQAGRDLGNLAASAWSGASSPWSSENAFPVSSGLARVLSGTETWLCFMKTTLGPQNSTLGGCVNPTQFAGVGGLRFPVTRPREHVPRGTWEQVCLTVATQEH